ncbi:D-amino-acid transaminase [Virgibacillus doumboii]|uniref:D-amino-acid transaminase n=1 Tax=Virgibacillus doumboii TaxID=2697503 RepID=UPI0013E06F05|nr:D-amino-acid transaminase [Virgibacillus doumboii]
MNKMLFNDQIMDRDTLVDIEDRAYQFGDGIYEVIGVYNGKPLMLDEHMERLERSAREIRLTLPESTSELKRKLEELVSVNELEEGIIYMQVSRGIASREHYFPGENVQPVTVAYTREEERMTDVEDRGAKAVLVEDIRWLRCDIKTLNLLPNAMAKQEAVENNAIEAILHRGETVTEASASNVFIVKNGELYTHPANNYILNGITRKKIIQLCDSLNIKVNEETYSVDDLLQADEVFVSATKLDVVPILNVDDHTIADGTPGEVTKRIVEAFRSLYQQDVKN